MAVVITIRTLQGVLGVLRTDRGSVLHRRDSTPGHRQEGEMAMLDIIEREIKRRAAIEFSASDWGDILAVVDRTIGQHMHMHHGRCECGAQVGARQGLIDPDLMRVHLATVITTALTAKP